jgi:methylenetetrahydrofolate--tRNA-(uracil-5-)-methyltransferase
VTPGKVTIIGAGLAGAEAAWQVARAGVEVDLFEMRPDRSTPAHKSSHFAELVCSNSLGSNNTRNASGLLKEELRLFSSLIIRCAEETRVPAGGALAVDRWGFARKVTEEVARMPGVNVIRSEVKEIPGTASGPVIVATGPLTSEPLARSISLLTGEGALFFYDAASPIVLKDSVDMESAFCGSRYGRDSEEHTDGEAVPGDYINCPMNQEEYEAFYAALLEGESAFKHDLEKGHFFEGCLPVEEIARRGHDTLRYGPMKPVGLSNPHTGTRPWAVVQLRQDDAAGQMYNIVGFQTSLKWGEQDRVFRMVPALRNAEFLRYGVMHRNTYIYGPGVLLKTLQTRKNSQLLFAGQIVGVEGYVESTAMGLLAGMNAARLACGKEPLVLPEECMLGALAGYVSSAPTGAFQPMNSNWGLLPAIKTARRGKRFRNESLAERALEAVRSIL